MTDAGIEPEAAPAQEPETAAAPLPQEAEIAAVTPHPVPWEDAGLSRFVGLFRTLRQVLFHPGDFFRHMPREGWAEALAFGLIVGTAGMLALLYWQLLFYLGLSRFLGTMPASMRIFSIGLGAIISMMVLSPVMVLGNLAFSSLGLWAAVGLTGGPWGIFTAVWRITCYSQGAMVAGVLPIFGGPVAGLWNLVLHYQGLRGTLELSSWRALAVLFLSLMLQVFLLLLVLGSLWGFRLFRG